MDIIDQVSLLIICLLLSAFFSGTETAFVSLSKIRIQHLLDQKRRGIQLVHALKKNNKRLIITILIGNNLVNIAASSIATSIAITLFSSKAIGIVIGGMTLLILIFGEIVPKNIAFSKNEQIAIATAPIIRALQYILFPAIVMLEWLTRIMSKPFENDIGQIITEEEIKTVVNLGEEAGEVEEDERIMIHNIFRFSDLEAYEIMVDRTQMFLVDAGATLCAVSDEIVSKGFSRVPAYEDKHDNIVGILYTKDVLKAALAGFEDRRVKDLIRPAMFIPETMMLDDLLKEFQKAKVHIAMVADEHGGISGLITIEDILEEIVGDIYDETDKEQIMIRRIDDRKSIVRGETEIEEINEALDLGISEEEDYETISGYLLSHLRRIPESGEELRIRNTTFRITKADEKHIIEVEIEKITPEHALETDISLHDAQA